MSSHIYNFTPAKRVLEIAKEHQRRGVDICKIVTGADTMAEQIENLRIITMLKESLDIPFLFLAGGECRILRRIGGEIGNCMDLCVCEHDEWSTPVQPLIRNVRANARINTRTDQPRTDTILASIFSSKPII